jgi:hypothetical protein
MSPSTRRLTFLAAVALAAGACGSDTTTAAKPSADAFVLTEWSVTAPTNTIRAGNVEVTVSNQGHETHELVIVRADNAAALPKKSDGSVDEDKILEADKVGEIPDLQAGKRATKALDLPAGRYIAICNIVEQMGMGNSGTGRVPGIVATPEVGRWP